MKKTLIELRTVIIVTAIAFIGWIISMYYFNEADDLAKEHYLVSEISQLEAGINGIARSYEEFAAYIFESAINKPAVQETIQTAFFVPLEEQARLREELYNILVEQYQIITAYEFRELQFHYPSGEVFLRFLSPDLYGDNIFDKRDTVRIANLDRSYVHGFEIGRSFNGYRYVYPIFHEGRYSGTAEISISLSAAIELLQEMYPTKNVAYLLDGAAIQDSAFSDNKTNFIPASFLDNYYFDSQVYSRILEQEEADSLYDLYNDPVFSSYVNARVLQHLPASQPFSFSISHSGCEYLVQFLPIINVTGHVVGYFTSISEDKHLVDLQGRHITQQVLISLVFISFILFFINYDTDKRRIRKMASRDSLTGIYNRRIFTRLAQKEFKRSTRYDTSLSIMMLDLDHFKMVNDTYGHHTGDRVLRIFSWLISADLRDSDLYARWGGEEFIILMPETTARNALVAAERIRMAVEKQDFRQKISLTVSIGVAERTAQTKTLDQLIHQADQAMYQAKKLGRNQVCS